jgi:hypothetical protein
MDIVAAGQGEPTGLCSAPLSSSKAILAITHDSASRPAPRTASASRRCAFPDDAFQVVALTAYEPWMTGTLVYSAAFWDHDCVGLRDA